jgi:hypothetical protein
MSLAALPAAVLRRYRGVLILLAFLVFVSSAWQAGKLYDQRMALNEARAAGLDVKHDSPFETIQKEWRAAFRIATWTKPRREIVIDEGQFKKHLPVLRRIQPTHLKCYDSAAWPHLITDDSFSSLNDLCIEIPNDLENLRGIERFKHLGRLRLGMDPREPGGSAALKDFGEIHLLKHLEYLGIGRQIALESLEPFRNLSNLKFLEIYTTPKFRDIEAVDSLPNLEHIGFLGKEQIPSMRPLLKCKKLKSLYMFTIREFEQSEFDELKATIPNIFLEDAG